MSRKPLTAEQRAAKRAYDAAYRLANVDKVKTSRAARYAANIDKVKAYNAAHYAANVDKVRTCNAAYRAAHAEQIKARSAAYRVANIDKVKTRKAAYYVANIDKVKARKAAWRLANPDKAKVQRATYHTKHPHVRTAATARRRAAELQRTPAWADFNTIRAIYAEASARGLTVDHILPLRGKLVSGLHVEHNLRVIRSSENDRKCHRFDPDDHTWTPHDGWQDWPEG